MICENCEKEIKKYSYGEKCIKCGRQIETDEKLCRHCKRLQPHFTLAFAVLPYKGEFKEIIRRAKFYNAFYLVKIMSRLIADEFKKLNITADCIVYVPTDIKTSFSRKYCLAQELAYAVATTLKLKVYKGFLIKKPTAQKQSLVAFEKRYKNIKNVFLKNPLTLKSVKNKTVLLIDDVLTTGATASECSRILKENGAKNVIVAALAYGATNKAKQ